MTLGRAVWRFALHAAACGVLVAGVLLIGAGVCSRFAEREVCSICLVDNSTASLSVWNPHTCGVSLLISGGQLILQRKTPGTDGQHEHLVAVLSAGFIAPSLYRTQNDVARLVAETSKIDLGLNLPKTAR